MITFRIKDRYYQCLYDNADDLLAMAKKLKACEKGYDHAVARLKVNNDLYQFFNDLLFYREGYFNWCVRSGLIKRLDSQCSCCYELVIRRFECNNKKHELLKGEVWRCAAKGNLTKYANRLVKSWDGFPVFDNEIDKCKYYNEMGR